MYKQRAQDLKALKVDIVDLDCDNLKDAPEWGSYPFSCKYCIYWEFPEERIDPLKESKESLFERKLCWLRSTIREFGICGKIAYANNRPAGYAKYAPPKLIPNSYGYKSGPPSDDAVFISCLFIPNREFRGLGLGSQILRCIIDELKRRRVKAVETFARRGSPENPSGPLEFYLKNGFKILRDDPEFPLVRLELF
jgi:GNAT superfamily N-acetyltransferase